MKNVLVNLLKQSCLIREDILSRGEYYIKKSEEWQSSADGMYYKERTNILRKISRCIVACITDLEFYLTR